MHPRTLAVITVLLGGLFFAATVRAQDRPIDARQSTVTVRVSTTGAFERIYEIDAPVMDGTLGEPADPHLQIAFDARRMRVLDDPALSARERDEMQRRMLGPDVLAVDEFHWISYHSLTMEPAGDHGWLVHGELSLRGQVHPLTVKVALVNNHYTGSATFRQSDFGIEPAAGLGGTVKVKDDVAILFDIVPEP